MSAPKQVIAENEPRLVAKPRKAKLDLKAFHRDTAKRFPKIIARLGE